VQCPRGNCGFALTGTETIYSESPGQPTNALVAGSIQLTKYVLECREEQCTRADNDGPTAVCGVSVVKPR
jgi:hypothetical protein